jgi:subtilisin family serine protease
LQKKMESLSSTRQSPQPAKPITPLTIIVVFGLVLIAIVASWYIAKAHYQGGAGASALSLSATTTSSPQITFVPPQPPRLADYAADPDEENWYIVKLKSGATEEHEAIADAVGLCCDRCYSHACNGFSARIDCPKKLAAIRAHKSVQKVERDFRVFLYGGGGSKPAPPPPPPPPVYIPPQQLSWAISRLGADRNSTLSGNGSGAVSGVDVYVIDTGCNAGTDLNIVESLSFVAEEPSTADLHGHGSHVAGIIGAKDNSSGIVGIAPGVRIHSYKVLDQTGSGYTSDIIAAIDHVIATRDTSRPAVINMSLGGYAGSSAYGSLDNAVKAAVAAGVVVCVAAGNEADDAVKYTPAHTAEAITVAAYNSDNTFASFSNYGSLVDICAPGVGILSLWKDGTTKTLSGTSMATPFVTGTVALYLIDNPSATPSAVKSALLAASAAPQYYANRATNPAVIGTPANTTAVSLFSGNF